MIEHSNPHNRGDGFRHPYKRDGEAPLAPSTVRPLDATAQMMADLMEQRGFRVARGTYHHGNGDILPTWVIVRPDTVEWNGVWYPWEPEPEGPEETEQQVLLELCGTAIAKWNEVAWMYCDEPIGADCKSLPDSKNTPSQ